MDFEFDHRVVLKASQAKSVFTSCITQQGFEVGLLAILGLYVCCKGCKRTTSAEELAKQWRSIVDRDHRSRHHWHICKLIEQCRPESCPFGAIGSFTESDNLRRLSRSHKNVRPFARAPSWGAGQYCLHHPLEPLDPVLGQQRLLLESIGRQSPAYVRQVFVQTVVLQRVSKLLRRKHLAAHPIKNLVGRLGDLGQIGHAEQVDVEALLVGAGAKG